MIWADLIPIQFRLLGIIVLAGACMAFGWARGSAHVRAEWDAANFVRVAAERRALLEREQANADLRKTQAAINQKITKEKDDAITRLTARIQSAGRLHVGTGICAGSATATEAPSPGSSDSADSSGGLVSERADRDFKALIVSVETDLATGRACQSFIKDNGLVP